MVPSIQQVSHPQNAARQFNSRVFEAVAAGHDTGQCNQMCRPELGPRARVLHRRGVEVILVMQCTIVFYGRLDENGDEFIHFFA
jgi:hypothetical protein